MVFSDDIYIFLIVIFILLRWNIVLYKFHILYISRGVSGTKSVGIWVKLKRRLFGGKKLVLKVYLKQNIYNLDEILKFFGAVLIICSFIYLLLSEPLYVLAP
jgi:hypothetical protein